MSGLTHLDEHGSARMVDVGAKAETARSATATGRIAMNAAALVAIRDGTVPKGDVLAAARIAGIMAAKQTASLIPLCHPLALDSVSVLRDDRGEIVDEMVANEAGGLWETDEAGKGDKSKDKKAEQQFTLWMFSNTHNSGEFTEISTKPPKNLLEAGMTLGSKIGTFNRQDAVRKIQEDFATRLRREATGDDPVSLIEKGKNPIWLPTRLLQKARKYFKENKPAAIALDALIATVNVLGRFVARQPAQPPQPPLPPPRRSLHLSPAADK